MSQPGRDKAAWRIVVAWLATMACLAVSGPVCATEDPLPERLVLETGDSILGRSHGTEAGELLWEADDGHELRIPLGIVSRVEPATMEQEVPPAPVAPPESPVGPDQGGEETPWIQAVPFISVVPRTYHFMMGSANVWTQRINFGGQFIDGNAQTDLINLTVNFENGTPREMRQIDLIGQWGRSKNRQTANKWIVNGNFDWPLDLDNKWISFFTSKNEYDAPANLDYRGTLSTGVGYRFFNEAKRRLITRVGPAYTIEIFREPADHRESPDLFAEMEFRWGLFERTSIEQRMRVQPSVIDWELVRVFSTTGLMLDLDDQDRWKLRLGLQYTYNSQPNAGREPSDYTSTVSLVYTRK